MTSRIEPVMTPQEWAAVRSGADSVEHYYYTGDKGVVIAACNDELPDDDPRKITREEIDALRLGAALLDDEGCHETARCITALADVLESYLPPE